MRSLNAVVSPLLLSVIGELAEKDGISFEKVARAVVELSLLFTKKRAALGRPYLEEPVLASAYLQYFLPVNLSKIRMLLDEIPVLKAGDQFSVLDLGSGPGTGALAVLDWWHERRETDALSIVAVDCSSVVHRQARHLWDHYCRIAGIAKASFRTCESDIERNAWFGQVGKGAPFDLIILANSLNEMYADVKDPIALRAGLMTHVLSLLAPEGTLMIVEPALRDTSRALHQVRDRLLQEKHCTVYSPCLHEKNCPALVHPDDWCHEERPWEPPPAIQQIDEVVGFIKDALKFSYLLLRKDGKTIIERRSDIYRVVSELRELKGEKRAWLCNEQGRQEVGRQDRLTSPQNAALDRWHRGAIVQIERIVRKERAGKLSSLGRIEQDVGVQIIRPV